MMQDRQYDQETEWNEKYREMRKVSPARRRPRQSGSLLLAVQLTACGVVLITALILRFLGGDMWNWAKSWYWDHLNSSIVAQENWDEVETRFWDLFPSTEENGNSVVSETEPSSAAAK